MPGAVLPLCVLAVTIAVQVPFLDRWFSSMDEGHMLHFADLLNRGGLIYRDATSYPLPGAFYLLAGIFRIFEPSILLSRWVVAIEFSLFVALIFSFVRRVASTPYALGAVVSLWLYRVWAFPHWHMYSYSTTALLLFVASMVLLARWLETPRPRLLALAGLVFGLGVFCKQDYGAAAFLGFVPTLVLAGRSLPELGRRPVLTTLGTFLGPAAAVGLAAAILFLHQGILRDVVQMTILNHLVGMSAYEYTSFPGLLPLFQQDPVLRNDMGVFTFLPGILWTVDRVDFVKTTLWSATSIFDLLMKLYYYAPYAFVAAAAVRLVKLRSRLDDPGRRARFLQECLLFAFTGALLLLVTVNKPQDYLHLAVLYWPLITLFWIHAHDLLADRPTARRLTVAVGLLPAAILVGESTGIAVRFRALHPERIDLARAGIRVKPTEAELLEAAVAWVRERSAPDEPVAIVPYFPIVHFLAERDAPHGSSYIVWPFPEFPDRDERIVSAMERQRAPLVLYNVNQFPSFPPFSEYAPVLLDYLIEHYDSEEALTFEPDGPKLIGAVRETGTAPGVPLLEAATGEPRLFVDDGFGTRTEVEAEEISSYFVQEGWPFRRALALKPSMRSRSTVLAVPLRVPDDAVLATSIGVNPVSWFDYPSSWVRFMVTIRAGNGASADEGEVVFDQTIRPQGVLSDRGWHDVTLSLARWAGRDVELELATQAEWPGGEKLSMGGWGEPRIVAGAER